MRRFGRLAQVAGVLTVLSIADLGLGQPSQSEKAAADALFDAARTLMEQKRYAEACPKLADSQALDPGIGTLLNLGRCYALNGQTASAWTTYREAAAGARAEGQAEREALARNEAAALEPRLTRVTINVSPEAQASQVTVQRDGKELPQGLWGVPIPVDPGEHTMQATAPGKTPRTAKFNAVGEGATISVLVPPLTDAVETAVPASAAPATLAPATATPAPAPMATSPAPPADSSVDQSRASSAHVLGYVAGGLGVVGLVAGAGLMQKGNSQNQEAKEICKGTETMCSETDQARHKTLTDDARTNFTRSYIAFGVGGALLATGVVLLLTTPAADSGATSVTAAVGPGAAKLLVSSTF